MELDHGTYIPSRNTPNNAPAKKLDSEIATYTENIVLTMIEIRE
jgi:hypothetical protein